MAAALDVVSLFANGGFCIFQHTKMHIRKMLNLFKVRLAELIIKGTL